MTDLDAENTASFNDPLQQPPPNDPIKRAHAFAYDLAYGVLQGFWDARFTALADAWSIYAIGALPGQRFLSENILIHKWSDAWPSAYILMSLGYMDQIEKKTYLLTDKAFSLLETPLRPPSVFISYEHEQSSAFALLIEARLKIAGNPNPFLDKNIPAGDEWHGHLEATIKQSEYFVCLVGPETLQSDMVKQEIAWAEEANCRIISIWHGCEINGDSEVLSQRQAIQVTGESALEYETAINQLLNSMGYSTY